MLPIAGGPSRALSVEITWSPRAIGPVAARSRSPLVAPQARTTTWDRPRNCPRSDANQGHAYRSCCRRHRLVRDRHVRGRRSAQDCEADTDARRGARHCGPWAAAPGAALIVVLGGSGGSPGPTCGSCAAQTEAPRRCTTPIGGTFAHQLGELRERGSANG